MNDVIGYLQEKGIHFKLDGAEVIIRCPTCNKDKLYINVNSFVYHCFYCEARNPQVITARGHFSKLKELWGDIVAIVPISTKTKNQQETNFTDKVEKYHYELFKNKKALRYLFRDRRVTEDSIKRFRLGFTRRHGQDWISLPSYEDGIPKLIKYRKLPPDENEKLEKYIREEGGKSILFNTDVVDKYDELFIAEGELDSISLIQQGYENVVGVTGGAGTLLPIWYDKLILKDKLWLVFDNDPPGQKAARDVWASRLGVEKCWNILLPKEYDLNKYFRKYTTEDFKKLVAEASRFKVEGISSLSEALYELYLKYKDDEIRNVFPTPWGSLNKLIGGGLKRQELVVLGGQASVGKTSLAMQICHSLAKDYNVPSLFFCLEMSNAMLATKVIQLEMDKRFEEVDPRNALQYRDELEDLPMYFGYSSRITPEIFYNTMKEARNRYGIELGVFDNLQLMIRSDKESDMSNASRMFKNLVMDLNMMFILVSQPRKLNEEEAPTFDDLKGSSAISQDADIVILLHRKRMKGEEAYDSFDPITSVIVDKERFASGGKTKLYLEGAKSKFIELEHAKEI